MAHRHRVLSTPAVLLHCHGILQPSMWYADIIPDRFTYNILLEAHTAADDLEGVANVYKAMTSRAVQPDICTFVALFQVSNPS